MPKPTKFFCGDLAENLLLYKDSYTFYRALPSQRTSSTPSRAQKSARSLWPSTPADWAPITSTPYSLVTPSASSRSIANMQMVFSPSPLPVSQVPSLVFPEISPPSQGSGSTPFERQFASEFSREWNNIHSQISPVARRNSLSSPTFSNAGGTPSMSNYGPTSQNSQGAVGRVSLIDRFISAAADEPAATENDVSFPTFSSQDRSSPLSDLSDLTPPPSPGLDLRSSSPPTSPTVERPNDLRKPSMRCSDQPPHPGRKPPSSRSTRSSSRTRDPDYQPAKGTTGCKRKRASRSRDGDETPTRHKKTRSARTSDSTSTDINPSLGTLTQRRLPTDVPYHPQFSLFYLRFPVSSYLRLADGSFVLFAGSQFGQYSRLNVSCRFPLRAADSKRVAGIYNEPRDALDLYTPRFVKGSGATKVGVCPICIESPSRGGKGEVVWLSMKFSAYKWHVSDGAFTLLAHIAPPDRVVFFIGKNTKLAMRPATTCSMPMVCFPT